MRVLSIDMSIAFGLVLACPIGCDSNDNQTNYRTLTNPTGLGIVRRPEPYVFNRSPLQSLPSYNPASTDSFQVDVRSQEGTRTRVSRDRTTFADQ